MGFFLWLGIWFACLAFSILLGLIPRQVARSQGKPNMAGWAMFWCTVSGFLFGAFLIFIVIGFVIAAFASQYDMRPFGNQRNRQQAPSYEQPKPVVYEQAPIAGLRLKCLSGSLKGRSYSISRAGLQFGRDVDCGVRFPNETPGISRHHCVINWQQGTLVLMDLGSSYGTFQGDGRQLPPNYPVNLAPGSRFYLANPANLFQIEMV